MGGGRREGPGRIRPPQCQRTDLLFWAGYPRGRVGWRWVQGRQKGGRLHSSARATVRAAGDGARTACLQPAPFAQRRSLAPRCLGPFGRREKAADTIRFLLVPTMFLLVRAARECQSAEGVARDSAASLFEIPESGSSHFSGQQEN